MSDVPGWTGRSRPAMLGRRQFLRAAAAGTAGAAAWSVTACEPRQVLPPRRPGARLIPFGTGWLFGLASAGSSQPGFDDSGLQVVTLPHTVTRLSWQGWDPDSWEAVWVYRKHFDAPGEAAGMRVFLDFAAAMTQAALTLNGHDLPGHVGGYLPFSAEITDRLKRGGNVLAVTLDSRFNLDVPPDRPPPYAPSSVDFWQPGGLYREVQLRVVPQVFLADVFAKPVTVLEAARRHIVVQCTVDAAVVPRGSVTILVELLDGAREISSATVPVTISKPGQVTVTGTLSGLAGITLWDIDNPKLYTVLATLQLGGAPLHDYQVRIGFREASFQLDGFFLNGRRVKLFGVNRHQFYPFAGGATSARVQRRDAEILRRELNCNMVRCSHYPQSEDFYNACDELGLMAWEEIPGWVYFGDAAWQAAAYRDVRDMIIRDRNHPSIIVWGAMPNEASEHVTEYTAYHELAHSLDDSRPTGGDGSRTDASYVFDVYSIHDYRHRIGPEGLRQPELRPATDAVGKPYLVCEAIGTLSGPAKHYRRTDSQDNQQGQAAAHARVHDIAASDDRYCGLLAWSGYDYNSGHGNELGGIKYTGVVDLFRVPKPGAAIYQSQLDPKIRPVIQPAFYWDFGPTSPITSLSSAMICSNLDSLEIYVGGAHHATVTPDTANYGHLPYPPSFADFTGVDGASHPELRIDGYLGGVKMASRRFSSDPATDWLLLAADDAELIGDGADETRVVFRAVDAHGAPRPYAGAQVQLWLHGPATLVGDNPFDFAAAGGVGAAWVRTLPNSAGSVTVRASHPVLGSAAVTIRIRQPLSGRPVSALRGSERDVRPGTRGTGETTKVTAPITTNNGLVAVGWLALSIQVPDDWAAAPGGAAREAVRRGAAVTGVDPAPMMLWLGRALSSGRPGRDIVFLRGTAEALPVSDRAVTVAWAISSAHHWADVPAGLRELHRVLRPGGRLIIAERLARPGARGLAAQAAHASCGSPSQVTLPPCPHRHRSPRNRIQPPPVRSFRRVESTLICGPGWPSAAD